MRESLFIRKNSKKWEEAEDLLVTKNSNPERASKLYQMVANDYSFARTHFYNRKVRVYLNELNQHLFSHIYKNRNQNMGKVFRFWSQDLPLLVYQCRKQLLLSLLIFSLATFIGVFSAAKDPDFTRSILGDTYIEQTLTNIDNGTPMAIYKSQGQLEMFAGITVNNIMIAFQTFVLGIFWAVGTVVILISNGIMLGSFQYFFVDHGLFSESALAIWQHGVIEISSIIIAGGAGLVMSKGILFPGTFSRTISIRRSALKGVKIMVGLVPLFIIAGFIEGFFTRHTELSTTLRLSTILISVSFIVGYFVLLPIWAIRKFPEKKESLEDYIDSSSKKDAGTVLSGQQIIPVLLRNIWNGLGKIGWWFIILPLFFALTTVLTNLDQMYNSEVFYWRYILPLANLSTLITYILQVVIFFTINLLTLHLTNNSSAQKPYSSILLWSLIGAAFMLLLAPLDYISTILIQPFLFAFLYEKTKQRSFKQAGILVYNNLGRFIGPFALIGLLILVSTGVLSIYQLYQDFFVSWNFVDSGIIDNGKLQMLTSNFSWQIKGILIIYLINQTVTLTLDNIHEIDTAEKLFEKIDKIGNKRKFKFEK